MTKFKCVKSTSYGADSPKVGDVIEGEIVQIQREYGIDPRILISKGSACKDGNGDPYFNAGETVPVEGAVWSWEEVK